jgi:hypothetical protein
MLVDEYQAFCKTTAIYADCHKMAYPKLGLIGEAGELANKQKKVLRDGREFDPLDELGDVLWYIATCATDKGLLLSDVLGYNYFEGVKVHQYFSCKSEAICHLAYTATVFGYIGQSKDNLYKVAMALAQVAMQYNLTLTKIAERNIAKLTDRKNRDVLGGSGDNR